MVRSASVDVNRTLMAFRGRNLIRMAHRERHVQDLDSLQEIAGVDSGDLYLDPMHKDVASPAPLGA